MDHDKSTKRTPNFLTNAATLAISGVLYSVAAMLTCQFEITLLKSYDYGSQPHVLAIDNLHKEARTLRIIARALMA